MKQTLQSRAPALVGISTLAVTAMYGYLALQRQASFRMRAFDLGIFDQGLWLLSRFQEPFVTVRGLDLFADHTSFIMVLLAPLYWLWPSVNAMILLTVVLLTAGGPLVYLVARRSGLSAMWSGGLAVAYLLHPAVGWNSWDSFHPEVVAVPLLLLAYYLLLRDRDGWAVLATVPIMLAKEDAALLLVPFGLVVAWSLRKVRAGMAIAVLAAVSFLVAMSVILPSLSPTGELLYGYRYSELGQGVTGILGGLLTDPGELIEAFVGWNRIGYVLGLVLPLPMALLAPRWLLATLPILLANLLSTHHYQFDIRYHYSLYALALISIGAVAGASRLRSWARPGAAKVVVAAVVTVALGFHLTVGPSPFGISREAWETDVDTTHYAAAVSLIPDEAVVSAFHTLVPHLTHREVVYVFPNPWVRHNYGPPGSPLPSPSAVDWVVTPTSGLLPDNQAVLERLLVSPSWEVAYTGGSVVALHRIAPGP